MTDTCDHGGELRAHVELHRYDNGSWGALGFLTGTDCVPQIVVQCDDPRHALETAGYELAREAEDVDRIMLEEEE